MKLTILLTVSFLSTPSLASGASPFGYAGSELGIRYRLEGARQVLVIRGLTRPGSKSDAQAIEELAARHLVPGRSLDLYLNYRGGGEELDRKLGEALRNLCPEASCEVRVIVPRNAECSASCLYLLMAGSQRIAHPGARFGFQARHAELAGKPLRFVASGRPRGELEALSIDKQWLEENRPAFHAARITYRSVSELEGSNIVTEVSERALRPE